nr:hypothetical protein [Acinetobacter baumannii]
MQALQWSVDYPDRLQKCVVIASAPKLSDDAIEAIAKKVIPLNSLNRKE